MERRRKYIIAHFLTRLIKKKTGVQDSEAIETETSDGLNDRMLRDHFHTLTEQKCPKHVTHEILRMTVRQEKRSLRDLLDAPVQWKISTGLVGAVAIALLVIIWNPKEDGKRTARTALSETEMARAKEQLKWSLAYTSQLIKQSERKAIHEAVMDELPKTIRNTLEKTVPIFKGGES